MVAVLNGGADLVLRNTIKKRNKRELAAVWMGLEQSKVHWRLLRDAAAN